ncbi:MAG: QueT transporter family protein [Ruminococcaceae bacterium]|nr:QueT transporter family protein [Oscillospiraceae bacterium]
MNMSKKIHRIVLSAVIAALYVALTYVQEFLFPTSATMAVQFRVSEALTVLSLFTPAAIPGLTVGCFIANFSVLGALPTDIILGSLASFLACYFMYRLKDATVKGFPFAALLMPAVFNGVIIGAEIEIFFIEGPFNFVSFLTQAGLVSLGELVVLYSLGAALVRVIKGRRLGKYLSGV